MPGDLIPMDSSQFLLYTSESGGVLVFKTVDLQEDGTIRKIRIVQKEEKRDLKLDKIYKSNFLNISYKLE